MVISCQLNSLTNIRSWFGMAMPNNTVTGVTTWAGDTPDGNIIGFRYSAGVDVNWKVVIGTGPANLTVIDTGMVADTNFHIFQIDSPDGVSFTFSIDGKVVASSQGVATVPNTIFQWMATVDNKNTNNARSFIWQYALVAFAL